YVMECLGESNYDYSFFAGLTGDNFTQIYPRHGQFGHRECAASDCRMSADYAAWVFEQVGYACEYVAHEQLLADQEHVLKKIIAHIDRGLPVICTSWGMFVGYENNGETLLFLTHEWEQPKRVIVRGNNFVENVPQSENDREHRFSNFDLIFVGEKNEQKDLTTLYREAISRLPAQLTGGTEDFIFGAAAFRAWADDIERGKFDEILQREGAGTWSYTNYVCVLATNGSCCFSFLEKARELNPDMSFLDEITTLYRKLGNMWHKDKDCLEQLGGGFNISYKTLANPRKRAKIVAKIREIANVTDEILEKLPT
ncbi:MAG: hypothetical protein FWB76_06805, partial [Oscillospiraceae bacterium]|nr:hypothetical protein [Oscillospiraceae bacterium]